MGKEYFKCTKCDNNTFYLDLTLAYQYEAICTKCNNNEYIGE